MIKCKIFSASQTHGAIETVNALTALRVKVLCNLRIQDLKTADRGQSSMKLGTKHVRKEAPRRIRVIQPVSRKKDEKETKKKKKKRAHFIDI